MTESKNRKLIKKRKKQHFLTRLMERFGLSISNEEYLDLIKNIENYNPKPLRIEENGNSFHRVQIDGKDVVVLYDWHFRTILTCYHVSWLVLENNEWVLRRKDKSKTIRYKNRQLNFDKEFD